MLAYILNISGWLLLPFMDGIAKYLSSEMHFIQIIWGRYFFMILVSFPLALHLKAHNRRHPEDHHKFHLFEK